MKTTPWFEPLTDPWWIGPYEINGTCMTLYAWWDGRMWGSVAPTPDGAYACRLDRCALQNLRWRGLAERPS
jgi:hypothetical protein